jgi:hypothetical protein
MAELFPYTFHECIEVILGDMPDEDELLDEFDEDAMTIYLLVHQRFILTSAGLNRMLEKYRSAIPSPTLTPQP